MTPTVPPEIMAHMLEFIDILWDREALASCSLASSGLCAIAQRLLFNHVYINTTQKADRLFSTFTDRPGLRQYVQSIAMCFPFLNHDSPGATSPSETFPHLSTTAGVLGGLTCVRVLSIQILVDRGSHTGSWSLIPADIRTAVKRLLDGSSPVQTLRLTGGHDIPSDLVLSCMALQTLDVHHCRFDWESYKGVNPVTAARIHTLDLSEGASGLAREIVTHAPACLSELRSLEFIVDHEWDSDPAHTTSVFDACAEFLQHLCVTWATHTHDRIVAEALHLNNPLPKLCSIVLSLPRIVLYRDSRNGVEGHLTAATTLQCLLDSLRAISSACALTKIRIDLPIHHGSHPDTPKAEDAIWENHVLKPLSPEIQKLWTVIDTTLSTLPNFPSLKEITIFTWLDFADYFQREDIEAAVLAQEGPEYDFEPLESYTELFPPRDRRRAPELFLRADELLPLSSQRARVEDKRLVTFEQWPIYD